MFQFSYCNPFPNSVVNNLSGSPQIMHQYISRYQIFQSIFNNKACSLHLHLSWSFNKFEDNIPLFPKDLDVDHRCVESTLPKGLPGFGTPPEELIMDIWFAIISCLQG